MFRALGRTHIRVLVATSTLYVVQLASYSKNEGAKAPGNPLDCQVPACSEKLDMFKKATKGLRNTPSDKPKSAVKDVNSHLPGLPPAYSGCPLDRNEVGNSSWDLLHTMAANYPDRPTEEQQRRMREFIEALALFYPCIHCAEDFQSSIKASPPRVASRAELSLWMCEQHNEVNEKLHKPLFPCTLQTLDERWRVSKRRECANMAVGSDLADSTSNGSSSTNTVS